MLKLIHKVDNYVVYTGIVSHYTKRKSSINIKEQVLHIIF